VRLLRLFMLCLGSDLILAEVLAVGSMKAIGRRGPNITVRE
jgi:hypothetical protein